MANGITGLPFPQFGGQQSPGITPVQLQPMAPNFPRPRSLNRRAPAPTTKEKLAGFAPLLLEGLGSLFKGEDLLPEDLDEDGKVSREEYLEYIGADPKNPDQFETARAEAYDLYGPPEEDTGTGWGSLLANMAAASMMDRGAADYTNTYFALRKAKKDQAALKEASRATYIKEQTKTDDKDIILTDLNAARLGEPQYRRARYRTIGGKGTYLVHDPNGDLGAGKPDAEGYVVAPEGWVDPSKMGPNWQVNNIKDPTLISLSETIEEGMTKDQAQAGAITVVNAQLDLLRKDIDDPEVTYTTLTSDLMNVANNARVEAEAILGALGAGDYRAAFNDGTGKSITTGGEGSGAAALEAFESLGLPLDQYTDEQLETILLKLERTADVGDRGSSWIKDLLGDAAYGNIRARANFLQLAYMAAAASGQTGRTLSDKDLAFFLEIVGGKGSGDPEILHDNLLQFMDQQLAAGDSAMRVKLGLNALPQYGLSDPNNTAARNLVGMYYRVGQNADGTENWDRINQNNYTYKNFYDRYFDNPEVVKFYGTVPIRSDRYTRPWNAQGQAPTRGTTSTTFEDEINKEIEAALTN